jgi:hypothetical protein
MERVGQHRYTLQCREKMNRKATGIVYTAQSFKLLLNPGQMLCEELRSHFGQRTAFLVQL